MNSKSAAVDLNRLIKKYKIKFRFEFLIFFAHLSGIYKLINIEFINFFNFLVKNTFDYTIIY